MSDPMSDRWWLDDERIAELLAESQALASDGCCSGPSWRGQLCQYHDGYRHGLWAAQAAQLDGLSDGL